jgi:DNA-directed RNA polymerase I subunit RPA49
MNANADANRLIPEFNIDATTPSEVYDLHNIIPEIEWKSISTKPFIEARSAEDRVRLLPHKWSSWVKQHLALMFKQDSFSKRQL